MIRQNKKKDKRGISIGDVIGGRASKKRKADELEERIAAALAEISCLKDTYRVFFQRALIKARSPEAKRNPAAHDTACRELKFAYCIYRYIDSLESAYRTVQSEMAIEKLTGEFAGVVRNLRKVRIPKHAVNFERLTAQALNNLRVGDINGIDDMTNALIDRTVNTTGSAFMSDSFIDYLISGRKTLDSAYDVPLSVQADGGGKERLTAARKEQDLRSLLDQINTALRR